MKSQVFKLLSAALLASTALYSPAASAQVAQQFVNAQTGTTYTMLNSDCSKLVTFSNASAVAVTLGQSSTTNRFLQGCFIDIENKGAGIVTVTPTTSTINGAATLVLNKNQGARIVSDGTNYQIQAGAGSSQAASCTSTSAGQCDGIRGVVTTSTLTTATLGVTTLAITNAFATASSVLLCQLGNYISTQAFTGTAAGVPQISTCTASAAKMTVVIVNPGTGSLNTTATIDFTLVN